MKPRFLVIPLQVEHVKEVYASILEESGRTELPVTVDDMCKAYFSTGSSGYTVLVNETAVLCGGIVNLGWKRGEAWVFNTSQFRRFKKSLYRIIRDMLPELIKQGSFRRVQTTSFNGDSHLIEHLGFEWEGNLRAYGPNGEDADIFSRIFPGG